MTVSQSRLDLRIDVLDKKGQRALVLPTLTPPELIRAILDEFRPDPDLEYLGMGVGDYQLLRASDGTPLEETTPLVDQMAEERDLRLVEVEPRLPVGTERASSEVYLREQATGRVYKLFWMPAIVGRISPRLLDNELVAVDLQAYQAGLRVSRRHLRVGEEDGRCFVENMSKNPAVLLRGDDTIDIPYSPHKLFLEHGDVFRLQRSGIGLRLIIRAASAMIGEQETGIDQEASEKD